MLVKSVKSKTDAERKPSEIIADWLTTRFGSVSFLVLNGLLFILWIIVNLGVFPSITPFDPFPFGLLTMIVSLQAIFLSIVVLISQNREEKVTDLREEADLQLDIYTEAKITKILNLVVMLAKKVDLDPGDEKELQEMLKPLDMNHLEKILQRQIDKEQ